MLVKLQMNSFVHLLFIYHNGVALTSYRSVYNRCGGDLKLKSLVRVDCPAPQPIKSMVTYS